MLENYLVISLAKGNIFSRRYNRLICPQRAGDIFIHGVSDKDMVAAFPGYCRHDTVRERVTTSGLFYWFPSSYLVNIWSHLGLVNNDSILVTLIWQEFWASVNQHNVTWNAHILTPKVTLYMASWKRHGRREQLIIKLIPQWRAAV